MATISLVEAVPSTRESKLRTLKWNPLFQTFPTQLPLRSTKSTASLKFCNKGSNFSVKCLVNTKSWNLGVEEKKNNGFWFDRVAEMVLKGLKALQKPVITAVMLGLLLMYDLHSALAASGGRMGGRAFSSHSSSSRSSSSSGFTRSSGPSFSSSSGSSSSSRKYFKRSSGPKFSYSAPYYAPSPFDFITVDGVGVGVVTEFLLVMGVAAFVLVSRLLSDHQNSIFIAALPTQTTSVIKLQVIKLQVGLLGMARSLQRDLDRIAEVADTSTSEGLSYVLTETTLALLRQPDYCISGYSSVDVNRSIEDGEKRFNQLSIEERGKFDEETLVNVNNIKRKGTKSLRSNGFSNEYIVITILVAAEGVPNLPSINSSADLKEALQKLASIPSSKTMAVEVLWTPQNENDTLAERELLEDYPLLRPLL